MKINNLINDGEYYRISEVGKTMIYIIGAGPSGSYAAYLLAKAGKKVKVLDKKSSKYLGTPIQCTGLLTKELECFSLVDPRKKENKKFIVNTLNSTEVNFKKRKVKIPLTEYLIDREKFDKSIAEKAVEEGAEFLFNHEFAGFDWEKNELIINKSKNKNKVRVEKIKLEKKDVIIGADGPISAVEDVFFQKNKKDYYFALQAVIELNSDGKTYKTYFNKDFSPTLFAWFVPENKSTARVGLATRGNSKIYFKNFLKFLEREYRIKNIDKSIIKKQAGLVPVYNPKNKMKRTIRDRVQVFLLGDAASQVKATTLGGIIPGLKAAEIIAKSICKKKSSFFKLNIELNLHLKIINMLNRLSKKEFDDLIGIMSKPKIKDVLKNTSRDQPLLLALRLFLAEPSLIIFLRKLF